LADTRVTFLLDNWYWIAAALVSGGALMWPMLKGGNPGSIGVTETVQLINREKAVVIDVCTKDEYAAGHVANSRNVPLGELETSKGLPTNKTLPLVVVCASGVRANRAIGTLTKLGHQRVHVLSGGLAAWREANMPIEKSA
jgi:rhodanese-related sulfurtransferase